MVKTDIIGNALGWFSENECPSEQKAKEWRESRNSWLRKQGVGGIIKDGKKSKSLPDWWGSQTEFWFVEDSAESEFIKRWQNV